MVYLLVLSAAAFYNLYRDHIWTRSVQNENIHTLMSLVRQVNIGCKDDLQERGPLINVMSVHHLSLPFYQDGFKKKKLVTSTNIAK